MSFESLDSEYLIGFFCSEGNGAAGEDIEYEVIAAT